MNRASLMVGPIKRSCGETAKANLPGKQLAENCGILEVYCTLEITKRWRLSTLHPMIVKFIHPISPIGSSDVRQSC